MLADRDVGELTYALSYDEFDQRARHGVRDHTEIALRKGIKAGNLETKVETDAERHRPGPGKVLLKAGEKIAEGALAATEKPMRMPSLRRPGSMRRVGRQGVALQHDDMFEEVGKRPRRRQASHPGANHDRLPADQSRRHHCLSWFILNAAVPLRTQLSFVSPCPRPEREIPRLAKPSVKRFTLSLAATPGVVNL